MAAAKQAPHLCLLLLLLLLLLVVLISAPGAHAEASCDDWSKLKLCKDALLQKVDVVERDCCDELKAQYGCLCAYTRVPNADADFLRQITKEAGEVILASCGLDAVSCAKSAAA